MAAAAPHPPPPPAASSISPADAAKVDAFIGSLISLTTKSDMRYEGFMYQLIPQESIIGLRNVKSYGTEGRRTDGAHVAPSERIYEYLCFRGSDIKDLQVISPAPIYSAPSVLDDPAIIRSHDSLPPANISLASPNALGGSSNANLGVQVSPFQGNMAPLQPVEVSGSWASLVPSAQMNVGGPAMQTYWPGFTGLPGGNSHFQHQPLPPPLPGLLLASPIQLHLPNQTGNTIVGNALNFVEPPRALLPPVCSGSLNSISTVTPPTAAQYSQIPLSSLFSNFSSAPMSNSASIAPVTEMVQSGPQVVSSSTDTSDITSVAPPVTNEAQSLLGPAPFPMISKHSPSTLGISSTSRGKASIDPPANLHSFQHSGIMQPAASGQWKAESSGGNVILPSAPNFPPTDSQNVDKSAMQQPNSPSRKGASSSHYGNRRQGVGRGDATRGGIFYPHQIYRGHVQGRGRGYVPYGSAPLHFQTYRGRPVGRGTGMIVAAKYPRPMARGQGRENVANSFSPPHHRRPRMLPAWGGSQAESNYSEEFDFEAMNENFNKEEIWGLLGKKDNKDGAEDEKEGDGSEYNEAVEAMPKVEIKPYRKEDFFDSISCSTHDRNSRGQKTDSPDASNPDAEIFGEVQRAQPGGHGFQGSPVAGASRGSYRGGSGGRRGRATRNRVD